MSAIVHHPDDANLMAFAAGSLPEALAAVVATHIAMCRRCSDELDMLELLGAGLIEDLPAMQVWRSPPPVSLRSLELQPDRRRGRARTQVPAPLVCYVGDCYERIAWRRLAPGIRHLPLPLSKGATGDLRLLEVAPGMVMPEHGHGGSELTLLLKGSYRDHVGLFREGDLADLDDTVEHQPVADPETGCICLIAAENKARFKSLFARLVQPLTGL